MSPFKKILPFNALRPEQLGQVICPNLTYLSILDLCDDPDALDGGEAALRALCDAQGRGGTGIGGTITSARNWSENSGISLTMASTSSARPRVFHRRCPPSTRSTANGKSPREVRQMSHAHDRFVHKLETFRQHEQELKE